MSKIKILVVEDSALIAEDIAFKLSKHHFEVIEIVDKGEDALEFMKKNEPDLVLLDIKLAGALDGISTGYIIQENYAVPIIYLSDLADAETLHRAKQTRPSNYTSQNPLMKPTSCGLSTWPSAISQTSVRTQEMANPITSLSKPTTPLSGYP